MVMLHRSDILALDSGNCIYGFVQRGECSAELSYIAMVLVVLVFALRLYLVPCSVLWYGIRSWLSTFLILAGLCFMH